MFAFKTGVRTIPAILLKSGMAGQKSLTGYLLNNISGPLLVSSSRSFVNSLNDSKKCLEHHSQTQLGLSLRNYVTKKTEHVPATSPPTTSSSTTSTPATSNLLQREQIEKYVFRIIAFFWDFGHLLFIWLRKMAKVHIVEDPTIRSYWKRFHEKMEQSKKDD